MPVLKTLDLDANPLETFPDITVLKDTLISLEMYAAGNGNSYFNFDDNAEFEANVTTTRITSIPTSMFNTASGNTYTQLYKFFFSTSSTSFIWNSDILMAIPNNASLKYVSMQPLKLFGKCQFSSSIVC